VIVPTVEFPPEIPLTLQVTATFVVLLTVALKSCAVPTGTEAVVGSTLTEIVGGGGVEIGFELVTALQPVKKVKEASRMT
jgi:hypothetical protein